MRVVVVCAWEPWRISDGAVLAVHHHLLELSRRHDLTVIAAGSRARREQRVATLSDAIEVRWFGTSLPPAVDYLARRVRSEWRREPAHVLTVERPALLRAVADSAAGADVVHLAGWGTAQLAGRVGDVPAVHFAVDPWAANWGNRRLPGWRSVTDAGQRRLAARHEQAHYPRCAAVVVVAEEDAALLRGEVPAANVVVVPNGVDAGPEPTAWPERTVIGFHGAFEAQANVEAATALVERILPLVRARVPDARAHIVGRSPPPEVLRLAGDGVEVRADVPSVRAELEQLTVHVDWMASGRGLKNKVLEAMAAGRPVVANALGAGGVGAGPGVHVAGDEVQAAADIVRLLLDPPTARAEGAAGRERVLREFTWERSARRLEQVWVEAAAR